MNLKKYQVEIKGDTIILRVLLPDDASQEYADWLNDQAVNQYLETRRASISDLKKYIQEKFDSDHSLFFGIFCKETENHIGNVKLEPINFDTNVATVGILIGNKDYWGRGIATEAIQFISEYAFDRLKLKEINLGVISENISAIRVYEKCGFEKYGVNEKALEHDGVLFDQILMRKLNNNC